MAASSVSVPTGLQLTYINRWIRSFARSIRTLPSQIFIFVAQRELACCFLHRQSIVSNGMLLIARALVLLIRSGHFDSGFVLSFLFSLVVAHCHCYFILKEAMITLSFIFHFNLQVEMNECDDASNASSWDFDMTLDTPWSKSIDNNRQELRQPPCAASPGGTRTMNIGIIKHSIPVPPILERTW
jgi:hypothetical protein